MFDSLKNKFKNIFKKDTSDTEDGSPAADAKAKPVKEKPDDLLLNELVAACMDYDMNTADEVMEKIDEYKYEADGGLAIWLRDNIDVMNYVQVVDRLAGAY